MALFNFDPSTFREAAKDTLNEQDVDILIGVADNASKGVKYLLSTTAHEMGLTPGRVRHRFFKALSTMETSHLSSYYILFKALYSQRRHRLLRRGLHPVRETRPHRPVRALRLPRRSRDHGMPSPPSGASWPPPQPRSASTTRQPTIGDVLLRAPCLRSGQERTPGFGPRIVTGRKLDNERPRVGALRDRPYRKLGVPRQAPLAQGEMLHLWVHLHRGRPGSMLRPARTPSAPRGPLWADRTPLPRTTPTMNLTKNCEKHGETTALPVQGNHILAREEWPKDQATLEALPRVCLKCLAESMVQPIRRSTGYHLRGPVIALVEAVLATQ